MSKIAEETKTTRFVAQAEVLVRGRLFWQQIGATNADPLDAQAELEHFTKRFALYPSTHSQYTGSLRIVRRVTTVIDRYVASTYLTRKGSTE